MLLKKIARVFALTLLLTSTSVFAEHKVEPFYKSDNAEFSAWAYSNIVANEKEVIAEKIRVRLTGKYKNLIAFAEIDMAGLDPRIHENYITQAWVGMNFKDPLVGTMFSNTTIRVGSLLTGGGLLLPAAYLTVPVVAQYNPFKPYAYGVQIQTSILKDLTLIADVTGTTGLAYNDKDRMSRTEISQRLVYDAIKDKESGKTTLQLAISNAWSEEFHRIGGSVKVTPFTNLDLYLVAWRADEHPTGKKPWVDIGGFFLADYKLMEFRNDALDLDLRVHGMIEKRNGMTDYTGYTGGMSVSLPEEGKYKRIGGTGLTFDITHSETSLNNGPKIDDTVPMARLRVLF